MPTHSDTNKSAPQIVTAEELAAKLRCSSVHIRSIAKAGKIPVLRVGKAFRFDLDAVMQTITKG